MNIGRSEMSRSGSNLIKIFALVAALSVASASQADLSAYSQNFEPPGINATDPATLGADGWLIFTTVFDSLGNEKFGFGPNPAPNTQPPTDPDYSNVVTDQGGAPQGLQVLSVFSDYSCCTLNGNEGHFNGTDLVESNVFREQTIGAADLESTWTFSVDAKKGNLEGATTAIAFIKVLDQVGGTFDLFDIQSVETTNIPVEWNRYEVSITIDPTWEGQLLQIGFANTSSNFEGSGIFYDNVDWSTGNAVDSDNDGVPDSADNCPNTPNAPPMDCDTDGDGFGNRCDGDLDNNGFTVFNDLALFGMAFQTQDPDGDLDCNGFVAFADLAIFGELFGTMPGR